jgi:hypothetical protein
MKVPGRCCSGTAASEATRPARPSEELCDEDGGVGLWLGAVDPLDARPEHAGVAAALAQDAAPVAAHLDRSRSVWWIDNAIRLLTSVCNGELVSTGLLIKLISSWGLGLARCRQWRQERGRAMTNSK